MVNHWLPMLAGLVAALMAALVLWPLRQRGRRGDREQREHCSLCRRQTLDVGTNRVHVATLSLHDGVVQSGL